MHVRVSRLADETNFHGNILVSLPVTALMLSMFYSADGVGNFISGKPKTSRNVLGNISRTLIVHGTVIVGYLRSTYITFLGLGYRKRTFKQEQGIFRNNL